VHPTRTRPASIIIVIDIAWHIISIEHTDEVEEIQSN
jgi:hypothetical protein